MLAVTVPAYVPAVVGVPLMTPAGLKLNPGGRIPAVKLNVGRPVDVYVKLYATPSPPFGGGPLVIVGGSAAVSCSVVGPVTWVNDPLPG